jgi:hypothetical protein
MDRCIVFLDAETVCLEPGPATIWELALIVRDQGRVDHELVWHIRPDVSSASAGSLGVGGYYERCQALRLPTGSGKLIRDSADDLGDPPGALTGAQVAGQIAPLLSKAILIGANAGSFDVPHLDAYLRAQGECLAADYHYLDIGSLVLGWAHGGRSAELPARPVKLTDAITLTGLDLAGYPAHQGLSDARAVRDIWDTVTGWSGR